MEIKKINLEKLSIKNWEACTTLEVHPEQKDALPDNLYSIAELNFFPQTNAVAILNEEEKVIGFATFGIPENETNGKIFRLMIDKNYQGKGYGKLALTEIVKTIFQNNSINKIEVCYHPEMKALTKYYGSVGFEEKEILPCKRRKEGKMLAVLLKEGFEK